MSVDGSIDIATPLPSYLHDASVQSLHSTRQVRKLFSGSPKPQSPQSIELEPVTHSNDTGGESTLDVSKIRLAAIIGQPSLINFFSSFTSGIITVALPAIARSLQIPQSLYLWPSSVYGLTSGSMLLLAGAIADVIGPRRVELVGCLLLGIFTLASGFSQTGIQLVVFRALQGIAMAMHLPASVSLVAAGVPEGRLRNFGFACLGLSQPMGFSVGMVASGIMVDRVGWRSPFFLSAAGVLVSAALAFYASPKVQPDNEGPILMALYLKVDWVGGALASGGLALLSYVLAVLSSDLAIIKSGQTIGMLTASIILLLGFPLWMHYREKNGQQALVPNSLWEISSFTSTCLMVALSYGVMTAMEVFSSLFFQEIQSKTAFTTSLYLLPNLVVGVALNFSLGLFVHRLPPRWLVAGSSVLCALAPLFMAIVNPSWTYWKLEFWAQVFAPMSADVLFTVGLIIISESFPKGTQGLAGAVFNTAGQFGQSLGVGICQLIAMGVSGGQGGHHGGGGGQGEEGKQEQGELLHGYRAAFWTMFAFMLTCGLTAVIGLRKISRVGQKRE